MFNTTTHTKVYKVSSHNQEHYIMKQYINIRGCDNWFNHIRTSSPSDAWDINDTSKYQLISIFYLVIVVLHYTPNCSYHLTGLNGMVLNLCFVAIHIVLYHAHSCFSIPVMCLVDCDDLACIINDENTNRADSDDIWLRTVKILDPPAGVKSISVLHLPIVPFSHCGLHTYAYDDLWHTICIVLRMD